MKEAFKVKLGEKIRELRRETGLTQEELAEKAGVSVNFIGKAERGESAASVRTLRVIARALGMGLKDLFDFPDEDAGEIAGDIMALLNSKEWQIDELRMVRDLVRMVRQK